VRQFIWKLPEEQRGVLMLVAVEGQSYKEAAETLDLPMGTITSRLARARLALNDFVHAEPERNDAYQQTGSRQ
jgi:RNA polymerase sigma-70 factor (ECF subfamily)